MGITYNKAKGLIDKGKKRRDGGSTVLESYMPIVIREKKKLKVEKPKMRPKKDPFRADKTKSLNEKFSMETAKANEKAIKEIKKAMGGLEKYEDGGQVTGRFRFDPDKKKDPPRDRATRPPKAKKKKKDPEVLGRGRAPLPPRNRQDPEVSGRGRAPLPPRDRQDPEVLGRGRAPLLVDPRMRKKDGGAFPDLSGDGKVTQKDILIGRGVIKKKMGGIARGGGAAIQGTKFKGVY